MKEGIEMASAPENKQEAKPFVRSIENNAEFICPRCHEKIAAGEKAYLELLQEDIDNELANDPEATIKPHKVCENCLDNRLAEEKE